MRRQTKQIGAAVLIAALAVALIVGLATATYTAISAVTTTTENGYATAPGSWTTLAGNTSFNYIDWPEGYDLIIGVNVTGVTASPYLTISAGDNPPAFRSGIGDKTISGVAAGVYWIGPLESARFQNSTGYLEVSSLNVTGTVAAIKVPT